MKKILIRTYYSEALNEKKNDWKNSPKLTLEAPTSQNGQTHSNNLLTNCLSVFGHFVGLVFKGLKILFSKMLVNAYDYWENVSILVD